MILNDRNVLEHVEEGSHEDADEDLVFVVTGKAISEEEVEEEEEYEEEELPEENEESLSGLDQGPEFLFDPINFEIM